MIGKDNTPRFSERKNNIPTLAKEEKNNTPRLAKEEKITLQD